MANSIEVTSTGQVVVSSVTEQAVEISAPNQPRTVEISTTGPQGPSTGIGAVTDLTDVDITNVANGSTLVYNSSTGKWVGNDETTVTEIVNGGNF